MIIILWRKFWTYQRGIRIRKSKKDRQTLNHFEIKLSQHSSVPHICCQFFVVHFWLPLRYSSFIHSLVLETKWDRRAWHSSDTWHPCSSLILWRRVWTYQRRIRIRKSKKDRQTLNHFEIKLSQHALLIVLNTNFMESNTEHYNHTCGFLEQEILPFRSSWVQPQFLVGFVLLDL
jgi:hypothetical protein